jgi:hypothetical protein
LFPGSLTMRFPSEDFREQGGVPHGSQRRRTSRSARLRLGNKEDSPISEGEAVSGSE